MVKPLNIGIIGCGAVSGQYLHHGRQYPALRLAACADLDPAAAAATAGQFGIPRACSPQELLADADIELVLNLTVPKAHAQVTLAALAAGKHVYVEKPLAATRFDGLAVMQLAHQKKLMVGCAPDTFLGSALQTARHAIDQGRIGKPLGFTAFMMCPGHESWHPSPEFYYEAGGGPMFDMGPYYLTALLNLLGPVKRLCGMATVAIPQRTIGSKPKFGKMITVQTPDHIAGLMEFQSGAAGTIIQSFAALHAPNGTISIFGEAGTLLVPDPNQFSGVVKLRLRGDPDWTDVAPVFAHDYGRSVGLADMAAAIREHRPCRASGEQGMAVLELMERFLDSSADGYYYKTTVPFQRPAAMPTGKDFGIFT